MCAWALEGLLLRTVFVVYPLLAGCGRSWAHTLRSAHLTGGLAVVVGCDVERWGARREVVFWVRERN